MKSDCCRFQSTERYSDDGDQILGLCGPLRQASDEDAGSIHLVFLQEARAYEIGDRAGDAESSLSDYGAMAAAILDDESLRFPEDGGPGLIFEIGREPSRRQQQINNDTASEPSR